ncbi:MAG: ribonuclease Z [Clostridia bacterium]|nr:ribonuclease Z [Clostridia bacterium]
MTVFVCLDENNGMSFNNRRQSRDSRVIEQIKAISMGRKLYVDSYSAKLFEDFEIIVDDNFLEKMTEGDFCFVEKSDLKEYDEKIKKLIVFKWNKDYPFDKQLDIGFENRQLKESYEFEGISHEKITCEVWVR